MVLESEVLKAQSCVLSKLSLRMHSNVTKKLAEKQKEMLKLIAPLVENAPFPRVTRILILNLKTSPLLGRQHLLKQKLRLTLKQFR